MRHILFFSFILTLLHINTVWSVGKIEYEPEKWKRVASENLVASAQDLDIFRHWIDKNQTLIHQKQKNIPLALLFECQPYCRSIGFADSADVIVIHPEMLEKKIQWILFDDPAFQLLLKQKDGSLSPLFRTLAELKKKHQLTDESENHESFGTSMSLKIFPELGIAGHYESFLTDSNLQSNVPSVFIPTVSYGLSYWTTGSIPQNSWMSFLPYQWINQLNYSVNNGLQKTKIKETLNSNISIYQDQVQDRLFFQWETALSRNKNFWSIDGPLWIGPSISYFSLQRSVTQDSLQSFSTSSQHFLIGLSGKFKKKLSTFYLDLSTNIQTHLHDGNDYRSQPAHVDLYQAKISWQLSPREFRGVAYHPRWDLTYIRIKESANANTSFQSNVSEYNWNRESLNLGFTLSYDPFTPPRKNPK